MSSGDSPNGHSWAPLLKVPGVILDPFNCSAARVVRATCTKRKNADVLLCHRSWAEAFQAETSVAREVKTVYAIDYIRR